MTAAEDRPAPATTEALRQHAEGVLRQSEERWSRMQAAHRAMREVRETATSPRREVQVTAAWGGTITAVTLPTTAYKELPSAEFARILESTVQEAQRRVMQSVSAILAPTLPEGFDPAALASGDFDVRTLLGERGSRPDGE